MHRTGLTRVACQVLDAPLVFVRPPPSYPPNRSNSVSRKRITTGVTRGSETRPCRRRGPRRFAYQFLRHALTARVCPRRGQRRTSSVSATLGEARILGCGSRPGAPVTRQAALYLQVWHPASRRCPVCHPASRRCGPGCLALAEAVSQGIWRRPLQQIALPVPVAMLPRGKRVTPDRGHPPAWWSSCPTASRAACPPP